MGLITAVRRNLEGVWRSPVELRVPRVEGGLGKGDNVFI